MFVLERLADTPVAKEELLAARAHILNHLEQLEGLLTPLSPRNSVAHPKNLVYRGHVGS